MIELVTSLFVPYGPVRVYPRFSKLVGFEWTVEAELDKTFEFLLTEKDIAPGYGADGEVVWAYLAGLLDSEGSVLLRADKKFAPSISIANKDIQMHSWIVSELARLGFYAKTGRGDTNGVFRTRLWRTKEVVNFLRAVPLRHPEKKAKARIILQEQVQSRHERWRRCANEIDGDISDFAVLARASLEAAKLNRV